MGMSGDALKKAADMLLGGATLMREPCPYCKGVRVIKEGSALCTSCGREPDVAVEAPSTPAATRTELEARLVEASRMLGQEQDRAARDALLEEIGAISRAIASFGGKK